MQSDSLELAVTVKTRDGRYTKIKEYGHSGLTYIEGREGQNFAIQFRNNSAHRVLAIPSIDGLSVLDSEAATPNSRGYIIEAYSTVEIKGWRTSLDDLSAFIFERKDGSYSVSVGQGSTNCGVIAMKVYAEKEVPPPPPAVIREEHHHHHWPQRPPPPPWPPHPYNWGLMNVGAIGGTYRLHSVGNTFGNNDGAYSAGNATMKCASLSSASSSAVPDFTLGAGFGEHIRERVTEAPFERANELATMAIYYTNAESLEKIGIDLAKTATVSALPQAFRTGFCKNPNGA